MIAGAMVAKSARYLAPIALAAVAVGVYLIVHAGLSSQQVSVKHPSQLIDGLGAGPHKRAPKYYVVKPGDTLSAISVKTHVPILRISSLNPGVSPNSLQTGQRLRLRR